MADAKDLFDSGEDVTELFASGEEVTNPEEISGLDAFLGGMFKGGTLGLSDELTGLSNVAFSDTPAEPLPAPLQVAMLPALGYSALAEKAAQATVGNISPEELLKRYQEARDIQRKQEAEIAYQRPGTMLAGEFVGGLAIPMPGAPVAKGAGFLDKAAAMAKTGAKVGAIAGLGTSEAELTKGDIGGAARDVAGSALLGGVTGAGLQAAGTGIKSLAKGVGKVATSFPLVQDITETFSRSKAGEELLGKVNELSQANRNTARELINTLEEYRSEAGKLMSASAKKLDESAIKIKLKEHIDAMREKIASMDPVEENEIADLEKFKKLLSNILKEEEKEVNRIIQVVKAPKATNLQKAEDTVAKKTAAAQAKDLIKRQEIEAALQEAYSIGDDEGIAALEGQLAKLKNQTEYPPINILDETTGLPVKGVPRGVHKQPIVETVMPQAEPVFTPINIETTKTITPRRTEATAQKLNDILRSLSTSYDKSETHVGRGLSTELKDKLTKEMAQAAESPESKQAADAYKYAKGGFQKIAKTQEDLGLPENFGGMEERKVEAINRLQRAIQETQKPGSMGKQVINEALDNLEKIDPDMAVNFRKQIMEGSRSEYLAREIAKESALSKDPYSLYASGKSIALLGARAAGKAAGALETGAAGPSQNLLKLGNKVYDATPDQLKMLADIAIQQGKSFAPVLNKVINAPLNKRKALLFTLMQQPEFREFAQSFSSNEEAPQ